MEHLEKGHFYRFQSTVYKVEEVYPDEKWGNHYSIRNIAYHESNKIWFSNRIKSMADGLDGVTKAEEDLHSFLVWALTQDYVVFYDE